MGNPVIKPIPRIRVIISDNYGPDFLAARGGIQLCFFMPHAHNILKPHIQRALDLYQDAIGRNSLGSYSDSNGDWRELDEAGWDFIHQRLHEGHAGRAHMAGHPTVGDLENAHSFGFEYYGYALDIPEEIYWPNSVCAFRMDFPTEFLEAQGPERFRALALDIAEPLPFSWGQLGLGLNGSPTASVALAQAKALSDRYLSLDVHDLHGLAMELGTHVRPPAWVNFIGPPTLQALGGVDALRTRLHSPDTTVEALGTDRAVVTLGSWPESGDTEQGQTLPAYRELARVLEPWLYLPADSEYPDRFYDTRAWLRRFLD
jgi:hypothetical protein